MTRADSLRRVLSLYHQFHRQTPQFALPILWEWPTLYADRRNRMQGLRRLTIALLCALLAILQHARGEVIRIATWNLEWFPAQFSDIGSEPIPGNGFIGSSLYPTVSNRL
jgi:hypothetical protein